MKRQPRTKYRDAATYSPFIFKDTQKGLTTEEPFVKDYTTKGKLAETTEKQNPFCLAITKQGKPCRKKAVFGQFCAVHAPRNIKSSSGSLYAKYIPSLESVLLEVENIEHEMVEEIKLLRALLTNILIKYEAGTAGYTEVLNVVEQLRKVLDYQSKFLPEKRPVDENAVTEVINNVVNIVISQVEDEKVLTKIINQLHKVLSKAESQEIKKLDWCHDQRKKL